MDKGKQKLVEKRVTAASMKELKKLVGDMYWDYDRMSSSGQETLDKIADILGIEWGDSMKGMIRFCLGFLVVLGSVGTVEVTPVLTAAQMWHLAAAIVIGTVVMWSGADALSKN
jgi:hypothetical protein